MAVTPSNPADTPAMRQHRQFKEQHPDCLLLFRMGDFYELFFDDAHAAHQTLGLTLTHRQNGVPMAGVPHHALDSYLRRLIAAGHRVAICDQVEDASQAKGLVKRDVTRVVTPGTLTEESLLDEAAENVLAAVQFLDDQTVAAAWTELSTGRLTIATFRPSELADELARIDTRELLYVETADHKPPPRIATLTETHACALTPRPAWQFRTTEALDTLRKQFAVTTLAGFGLEDDEPTLGPAGAVIAYLHETQQTKDGRLAHIQPPKRYERAKHLIIDQTSLRSLEVERTLRTGQTTGSMLATLQDCRTPMGKRLLRHWLCFPLCDRPAIEARQDAVAALAADAQLTDQLTDSLKQVQDVERIASRISIGRPSPRDLVGLGASLAGLDDLLQLIQPVAALKPQAEALVRIQPPLTQLAEELNTACIDEPPAHLREGGLIRDGFDKQLDEYRSLQSDAGTYLADYQAKLTEQTGIPTLKLGYNKVFGYYIEVTQAQSHKVPDTFTRKQTLKNAERYITPELKGFEDKILGASQKAIARELDLFDRLRKRCSDHLSELAAFASTAAELDVLGCFARRVMRGGYVRPRIVDEPVLYIRDGRHPVLDRVLADRFVPNDTQLGEHGEHEATLALITGPNMAGKSTYIRQSALITLLAHTGSFVPAKEAVVGLTDRIFTRIGASDEIHLGQSTFMVEMTETANICHHATEKSLVILDEIGRGTSTLDGLALAWAIAEHLAKARCRTLFATHYHELTDLPDRLENVANLNVTVREWEGDVVFLHRIAPGRADKSYGIHVAKIAGLPRDVVQRAEKVMGMLEVHTAGEDGKRGAQSVGKKVDALSSRDSGQMGLFTEYVEHPAVTRLKGVELEKMSPLEAFDLLRKLRDELGGDG